MNRAAQISTPEFDGYFKECRTAFSKLMNEMLESGQAADLPPVAICVGIIVAAIHCQALAMVGGKLSVEDFDGLVEEDMGRIQQERARRGSRS